MAKKFSLSVYIISLWSIIWGGLFIVQTINNFTSNLKYLNTIYQYIEIIAHIFILVFSIYIYKQTKSETKSIFKWFILTNLLLFLNNISFYIFLLLQQTLTDSHLQVLNFSIDLIIATTWHISAIILLIKILIRIISQRRVIKILFFLILASFIILGLFLSQVQYNEINYSPMENVLMVTSCFTEFIIFDLAILCLIYSANIVIFILIAGFIILITGDYFVTYCLFSHTQNLANYGELVWFLGLLWIIFGLSLIIDKKYYNLSTWFNEYAGIKGQLTFWTFSVTVGSFILFFIITYEFSVINKDMILCLPPFILAYSIIVVALALIIGKTFEHPFNQIRNNIKELAITGDKTKINSNFSIEEFIFLQKSIEDSFKYRDERDKVKYEFGELAAQVAHDLRSPVTGLDVAITEIRNDRISEITALSLNNIEKLVKEIKNISASIVTNYYQLTDKLHDIIPSNNIPVDDGNLPRFMNIANLLNSIISTKQSEWSNNPCSINLIIDNFFKEKLVYIAPTKILRILSNLLNNSYQSLYNEARNIWVDLRYLNNEYFILNIKDSGCGISKEKINEVMGGKSSKHSGKGLGLSSSITYLRSIKGDLFIESEINKGTQIILNIPLLPQPQWLDETIAVSKRTILVALDDDATIILTWQKMFSRVGVKSFYFINSSNFLEWYKDNKNNEIVLLSDYDLKEDLTGLEIITKTEITQAYLVTDHAEEYWLQEKVKATNIKLIPKSRINNIQIVRA
ncbi:MAG: hypothetical protein KBD37_06820 [Burkholderiales bacterium]|nr:hypothetical protein [Burkholderiales bacterium]